MLVFLLVALDPDRTWYWPYAKTGSSMDQPVTRCSRYLICFTDSGGVMINYIKQAPLRIYNYSKKDIKDLPG